MGAQFGLQPAHRRGIDQAEIVNAIGAGARGDDFKLGHLRGVGGDDDLAASAMGQVAFLAIAVQQVAAGDAGGRLQAARRIIDTGVDDLAVARTGLGANRAVPLRDDHGLPGHGEGAGHGQPDDSCSNDKGIDIAHGTPMTSQMLGMVHSKLEMKRFQ